MREIRDWTSLERGLLRDIFLRLPADADAVRFRRMCRGWRVAAGAGAPAVARPAALGRRPRWPRRLRKARGTPPPRQARPRGRRRRHGRMAPGLRDQGRVARLARRGRRQAPPPQGPRLPRRGPAARLRGRVPAVRRLPIRVSCLDLLHTI